MQKTLDKSKDPISQAVMHGALDFLVKMCQSLESKQESAKGLDPVCSLRLSDYWKNELGVTKRFLPIYSLKMLRTCYQLMEDGVLQGCKIRWTKWGTTLNGQLLTLPKSSLNTGNVYSLSDILEDGVPEKYFLSSEKTEKLIKQLKK